MNCFIEYVFDWAINSLGPLVNGGLLPLVRGYAIAVENDASQSLHAHTLVCCVGDANLLKKLNITTLCKHHRRVKGNSRIDGVWDFTPSCMPNIGTYTDNQRSSTCSGHDVAVPPSSLPPIF